MAKSLVTGGSGFIGSHLVDALVDRGDIVTVIDFADPTPDRRNAKATYINCDIRDKTLAQRIVDIAPNVVFHLAAHIDDRASVLDPIMNADHNELGSINVFEASKRAGVQSIVFASSCAAYGLQDVLPIRESAKARPQTPYGISKFAAETYLDSYGTRYNMHVVSLRFANVYGPRQYGNKEAGAIAIFAEKLLRGESPFLNGDGTTTRDYVFVHDVVAALIAASASTMSGVYNVGTGREVSTKALFDMVAGEVGTDIRPTPRPEVVDAVARMSLDTSAAQKAMFWQSTVLIEDGIRETIAWYRKFLQIS